MTALVWLLAAGALYRLTLLVVADQATAPLRDWLVERASGPRPDHDVVAVFDDKAESWTMGCRACGETGGPFAMFDFGAEWRAEHEAKALDAWRAAAVADHGFAFLLSCPWCASVWLAPAVVGSGLAWGAGWGWQLAAGALALSGVTGFLASYASPD